MVARYRIIREVLDDNGKGLVSSWVAKELTNGDKAKIESRFNQIEINEARNPNWMKPYVSLKLTEIRVDSGGKALRFLCVEDGTDAVLLVGCVKKGQISGTEEARAKSRKELYLKGQSNVRNYPLPQRTPDDVEEPD